jgi:hypothetical protein
MDIDTAPEHGRVGAWMRGRQRRQWLVLGVGLTIMLPAVMVIWFAVSFLIYSPGYDSAAAALNIVLSAIVGMIGVPLMQSAMYRWLWHLDRKRAAAPNNAIDDVPYGSEPTLPAPRVRWPWSLRVRHALSYIIGVGTLLYTFLPYAHQVAFTRFIADHSAGTASAGSLGGIVSVYLPMVVLLAFAMLFTYRGMRRRDAGLMSPAERMVLMAEFNWLIALTFALGVAALPCRLAGGMILAYL